MDVSLTDRDGRVSRQPLNRKSVGTTLTQARAESMPARVQHIFGTEIQGIREQAKLLSRVVSRQRFPTAEGRENEGAFTPVVRGFDGGGSRSRQWTPPFFSLAFPFGHPPTCLPHEECFLPFEVICLTDPQSDL